jgi:predicted Zn-dependent protease
MTCLLLVLGLVSWGLDDITDIIRSDDAQTAIGVVDAFVQAGREISDSEEYHIGRAVAANILKSYTPVGGYAFHSYLNAVGSWVAMNSPKPCTYGGWHFQLLSSSEINAMACPGGTIFITRGLLDQIRDEDELACVLAHEIAHVCMRHGLGTVQQARWVQAFSVAGMAGAERFGSREVQEAAESYGDVASDITEALVTKGYSRSAETAADSLAVIIAASAGYDPAGLTRVLSRMSAVSRRSGPGFWQTHPSPEDRMNDLDGVNGGQTAGYASRKARFEEAGYASRKARFEEALATAGSPASYSATGSQPAATGTTGGASRGGSSGGSRSGSSGGSSR